MSGSYTTVLVGTDGSESSYRAVERAAAVAHGAGATLLLVTAYRPMGEREARAARDALGDEAYKVTGATPAEDVLRDAADRARTVGSVPVETLAVEGDAVDALIDTAAARSVDLLVIGNRGLNSLAGRLLGSVPASITHKASCDVLVVHTTGRSANSS